MNLFMKKCSLFFSKLYKSISKHQIIELVIIAFFVTLFCETFSRRSLFDALVFLFKSPHVFLLGGLIVFSSLTIIYFTKRRNFWKIFISLFWIIICIVNSVMFSFRLMPFSFNDLLLIPSTFTVLPKYLSVFQMVLIGVCVCAFFLLLVIFYKKTAKKVIKKRYCTLSFISILITVSFYIISRLLGFVDNTVSGLISKYERNGFVYCFTSSIFERGMYEPDIFSKKTVDDICDKISSTDNEKPIDANIIFLQLESFFDVNNVKELEYSENPIPVFNKLENLYSHGFLTVPTFSAGTANTEFEVLSAMTMDYFGIGEVAYQTVVGNEPIETVCYTLKDQGYKTHAIHNNSASFYNRNTIYKRLGFDTFTSLEYMYDVEYNVLGWARDKVLISSINDCLNSTSEKDFIYTVAVQSHGTYPDDIKDNSKQISVKGIEDESIKSSFEYYLSQIKEVDTFIGDLIHSLKENDEPTVLVIFGDHMPGFDISDDMLKNDTRYQTEYVIWDNIGLKHVDRDLHSYQVYSYVLDMLNLNKSNLGKLHKYYDYKLSSDYLKDFEIIQYDMIEGKGYSKLNDNYKLSDAKLGIKEIVFYDVNNINGKIVVSGSNFNEFTKICVNDEVLDTNYVNSSKITSNNDSFDLDLIKIVQVDETENILSFAKNKGKKYN